MATTAWAVGPNSMHSVTQTPTKPAQTTQGRSRSKRQPGSSLPLQEGLLRNEGLRLFAHEVQEISLRALPPSAVLHRPQSGTGHSQTALRIYRLFWELSCSPSPTLPLRHLVHVICATGRPVLRTRRCFSPAARVQK